MGVSVQVTAGAVDAERMTELASCATFKHGGEGDLC